VQYGQEILPLVRLAGDHGSRAEADDTVLTVVVCATRGRTVGLVVDAILDIVEGGLPGPDDPGGAGPLGAAVVRRRITELLDVEQAVREADPQFYDADVVPARGGP
jgi:two-component system chemotaxis sensor kinase CheA